MNRFALWFVKVTALPVQWFYFRKKIYYINKEKQGRTIDGGALIISNHTSVYDYPLIMFTFRKNRIRTLVAKSTADKSKLLTKFLKLLGCIIVDRKSYDFTFMSEMKACVKNGDVGLIFPEAKIVRTEEDLQQGLLPFKPSFVYIALEAGVPIIPVYTNGIYGKMKRKMNDNAKIIIGEKIFLNELIDTNKTNKDNIDYLCNYVKDYIKFLGEQIDERGKKSK